MRHPTVAGQFYAADKEVLLEEINASFLSEFGPGLPGKEGKGKLLAAISPHAGYVFSGPCAAHCYKAIAEAQKPDLFVILGPSHQGLGSCISLEDWKTPIGIAKVDKVFGKALVAGSRLAVDENAHAGEHSIEVQLPFLQFACREFKFLPVMVGHDMRYSEIAEWLIKAVAQTKKKAVFIASSDFTHYGPSYGYTLAGDARELLHKLDSEAIEAIKSIEPARFLGHVKKHDATICGTLPILALLSTIKSQAKQARLLKY